MNYKKIYNDLCESRLSRGLIPERGYEMHHIVPRSLGGSNRKDNLVKFTCREHYIAHKLLTKIYKDDKEIYHKMVSALWFMSHSTLERKVINSREFSRNREEFHRNSIPNIVYNNSHKNDIFRAYHWKKGIELDILRVFIRNYKKENKGRVKGIRSWRTRFKLDLNHYRIDDEAYLSFCYTIYKLGYRGLSLSNVQVKRWVNRYDDFFTKNKVKGGKIEFRFSEKMTTIFDNVHIRGNKQLLLDSLSYHQYMGAKRFLDKWNKKNPDKFLFSLVVGGSCYLMPINAWNYEEAPFIMHPLTRYDLGCLSALYFLECHNRTDIRYKTSKFSQINP